MIVMDNLHAREHAYRGSLSPSVTFRGIQVPREHFIH